MAVADAVDFQFDLLSSAMFGPFLFERRTSWTVSGTAEVTVFAK